MRRPMVFILLAYACGIAVGFIFKFEALIPIGGLVLLIVLLLSAGINPKLEFWRPFLLVFFLGCLYLNIYAGETDPFSGSDEKQVTIVGYVISAQQQYKDYFKLEVAGNAYDNGTKSGRFRNKILVNLKGPLDYIEGYGSKDGMLVYADLVGREIRLTGTVQRPPAAKNPHLFDYSLYLKTRNISTIIETNSWQCSLLSGKIRAVSNGLALYKYSLMEQLGKSMSQETFGLMVGILFGDKNFIDDSIYQSFQKNGTAHILSVSGIHVGIIYAYIDKLLGKGESPLYNAITIGLLMVYAALSGFSPSVDRAVFMIIIFIIGKLLHERYDLTTCTAFSAFVLLLYNPYNLFNLGFQLSYIAVFILAVILPWLTNLSEHIFPSKQEEPALSLNKSNKESQKKIVQIVLPLIAIQIGLIPITAYIFNYFSLSAFIINVPVILLAGFILPLGILLMLISLLKGFLQIPVLIYPDINSILFELDNLLDFLFSLIAAASQILIWLMIRLNELTAVRGIGYFNIQNPAVITIIIYYCLLFLCCSELGQWYLKKSRLSDDQDIHKKQKIIVSGALILLLLVCILRPDDEFGKAELIFLDVGQGDCLHIRTPSGKNILIDGGGSRSLESGGSGYDVGSKILLPYFLKSGVTKIDMAIISHLHDDHYKGLVSLSQAMPIEKIALFSGNQPRENEVLASLSVERSRLLYVNQGDRINIEPGVFIDILYPEYERISIISEVTVQSKAIDENAMNLLLRLNYNGLTLMMTGDLTGKDESIILQDAYDLKTDILKVPHHGSRYSSTQAFIEAVDPSCAIIQVGKNNFGHPNGKIIENYEKRGIMIFRTDLEGAILFDINLREDLRVMTMKKRQWETVKL